MNEKKDGSMLALFQRRVIQASVHSWQGLRAALRHEEAFRVEFFLALLLFPVSLLIAENLNEWLLLFATTVLVLIVELLNSAIEATVDRIGDEPHELAGRAKDIGSAAVLLSMGLFLVVWFALAIG